MTRYNYNGCYLFFETEVADADLKTIIKSGAVHYCKHFEMEELFLERHSKTKYTAVFLFEGDIEIKLVDYDLIELDKTLQKLITPVWLMHEMYKKLLSAAS